MSRILPASAIVVSAPSPPGSSSAEAGAAGAARLWSARPPAHSRSCNDHGGGGGIARRVTVSGAPGPGGEDSLLETTVVSASTSANLDDEGGDGSSRPRPHPRHQVTTQAIRSGGKVRRTPSGPGRDRKTTSVSFPSLKCGRGGGVGGETHPGRIGAGAGAGVGVLTRGTASRSWLDTLDSPTRTFPTRMSRNGDHRGDRSDGCDADGRGWGSSHDTIPGGLKTSMPTKSTSPWKVKISGTLVEAKEDDDEVNSACDGGGGGQGCVDQGYVVEIEACGSGGGGDDRDSRVEGCRGGGGVRSTLSPAASPLMDPVKIYGTADGVSVNSAPTPSSSCHRHIDNAKRGQYAAAAASAASAATDDVNEDGDIDGMLLAREDETQALISFAHLLRLLCIVPPAVVVEGDSDGDSRHEESRHGEQHSVSSGGGGSGCGGGGDDDTITSERRGRRGDKVNIGGGLRDYHNYNEQPKSIRNLAAPSPSPPPEDDEREERLLSPPPSPTSTCPLIPPPRPPPFPPPSTPKPRLSAATVLRSRWRTLAFFHPIVDVVSGGATGFPYRGCPQSPRRRPRLLFLRLPLRPLLDVLCYGCAAFLGLAVPLYQALYERVDTADPVIRWLDRKSFAFQWLTFAVSWWVLQARFCRRPLRYALRDVLFLGDALSGAAPPRHRRRVHAAYCALVRRRAAAELLLLLLPFAALKFAAVFWVRFGRRARGETVSYLVPAWTTASGIGTGTAAAAGEGGGGNPSSPSYTVVKLEGFAAAAAAGLGLASEVYLAAVFLAVCMLFRLVCALTLLKLNAFLVMIQDSGADNRADCDRRDGGEGEGDDGDSVGDRTSNDRDDDEYDRGSVVGEVPETKMQRQGHQGQQHRRRRRRRQQRQMQRRESNRDGGSPLPRATIVSPPPPLPPPSHVAAPASAAAAAACTRASWGLGICGSAPPPPPRVSIDNGSRVAMPTSPRPAPTRYSGSLRRNGAPHELVQMEFLAGATPLLGSTLGSESVRGGGGRGAGEGAFGGRGEVEASAAATTTTTFGGVGSGAMTAAPAVKDDDDDDAPASTIDDGEGEGHGSTLASPPPLTASGHRHDAFVALAADTSLERRHPHYVGPPRSLHPTASIAPASALSMNGIVRGGGNDDGYLEYASSLASAAGSSADTGTDVTDTDTGAGAGGAGTSAAAIGESGELEMLRDAAAAGKDVDDDDDRGDVEGSASDGCSDSESYSAAAAASGSGGGGHSLIEEHVHMHATLRRVGHRFRFFLVLTLLLTFVETSVGFYDLLVQWNRHGGAASLARVDLLLSAALHVAGVHLNVRAATLITHRLQRVVGYASQQHAALTVSGACAPPPSSTYGNGGGGVTASAVKADVGRRGTTRRGKKGNEGSKERERLEGRRHRGRVDMFLERSAVLGFFRDQPLGISIYGFVCDRHFFRGFHMVVITTAIFIVTRAFTAVGQLTPAPAAPAPTALPPPPLSPPMAPGGG